MAVGAGAFGGWAALNLARSGADVTLVEAWAAGHPRSSSGGETRVIRHMYANPLYARMAARALSLFDRAEREWNRALLHRSGVLFLGQSQASGYFDSGMAALRSQEIGFDHLDREAIAARWPQIALEGIEQATSGHGFKHGPALGELIAESVLGEQVLEPVFTIAQQQDSA